MAFTDYYVTISFNKNSFLGVHTEQRMRVYAAVSIDPAWLKDYDRLIEANIMTLRPSMQFQIANRPVTEGMNPWAGSNVFFAKIEDIEHLLFNRDCHLQSGGNVSNMFAANQQVLIPINGNATRTLLFTKGAERQNEHGIVTNNVLISGATVDADTGMSNKLAIELIDEQFYALCGIFEGFLAAIRDPRFVPATVDHIKRFGQTLLRNTNAV